MKVWHIAIAGMLMLLVTLTSAEAATDNSWRAEYYNNLLLSGSPTVVRQEANLINYWGNGSPDGRISADRFSARYTRRIDLGAGTYKATVNVDDGVRVYVNGQLIIDKWQFQSTTHSAEFSTSGGETSFVIEYFENTGNANIDFGFVKVNNQGGSGGAGGGDGFAGRWRGEYFNNRYLSGAPALIRASNTIDFDWGNGSPDTVINADNFSVRWTKTINTTGGRYRFTSTSDDGVRVFVNGGLIIDKWFDQLATQYSAEINLPRGNSDIEVQYYEHSGNAEMRLRIDPVNQPTRNQTVIVDNVSSQFSYHGPADRWVSEQIGYNGSLLRTSTLSNYTNDQNYAYWTPSLAERRYEVQIYIPTQFATTVNAQYWVNHKWGRTMVPVNQAVNAGKWVSLGIFDFAGDGSDAVSLSNITYEAQTRQIAFDAIIWIPR